MSDHDLISFIALVNVMQLVIFLWRKVKRLGEILIDIIDDHTPMNKIIENNISDIEKLEAHRNKNK